MSESWQNVNSMQDASEDQPDCQATIEKVQMLFAQADKQHEYRQKCPYISLQPSPSEAGDLQEAMTMGAGSGSAEFDKYMLAKHIQAIRRRAASIEKAIYFMEKRQDSAASLPSETGRHASQFSHEYSQAMAKSLPEKAASVKRNFKQWKTDLLYTRYSQVGCFGAMFAALYYRL
jgi:hypothetical protein